MATGTPPGIYREVITVTTTGSAGSATGTATSNRINGFILGIYFNFHASTPATADTTVAYDEAGGNIVVLSNTTTDVFHFTRKQASDATGTAITGVYDVYPVAGTITVSLAGADALTAALVATVYYLSV